MKKIENLEEQKNNKKIIPIFFASDINYLPFLSVTLQSLKENANKKYLYKIYILHNDVEEFDQLAILEYNDTNFTVEFVDINKKLDEVKNGLQLRDYYSGATYYRIFIANMFPEYDKAIYLDCDTVVLGDISKLYKYNLKNNYVGAITDKVVSSNPIFKKYCKEVLGVKPSNYFNAGILLMNLKKFREEDFYEKFKDLLLEYKFRVAQDQDYLNVLCKDQVLYLPYSWNTMPIGGEEKKTPNIIHYNLTLKPWHYADIPYAKYFWNYVKNNVYGDYIRNVYGSYTLELQKRDELVEQKLVNLALEEIKREDNYIKTRIRVEIANKEENINSNFEYYMVGE